MKSASWLSFFLGLALITLLALWQDVAVIAQRLTAPGWGILWVAVFALPDLLLSSASWRFLFTPNGHQPTYRNTVAAMWIGTSVNTVLPVASVGGEWVKARLLTKWATPGTYAAASVVVDKTVQALSVLLGAILGMVFLFLIAPDPQILSAALLGCALLAIGIIGFVLAQCAGTFGFLARLPASIARSPKWQSLASNAVILDTAILAIYRQPSAILLASGVRLLLRILMAGEVWLAALLIGYPIKIEEALILTSLGMAIRSAGFVIPGGLGIQEGGFIAIGTMLNLPPHVALSISLATRIRELITAFPGLLAWQYLESQMLWPRLAAAIANRNRTRKI